MQAALFVIRFDCPNHGPHRTRSPLRTESPGIATEEKPPAREFGILSEGCQVNGFGCCCEEYGLADRARRHEKVRNHYRLSFVNTRTTSNSIPCARLQGLFF